MDIIACKQSLLKGNHLGEESLGGRLGQIQLSARRGGTIFFPVFLMEVGVTYIDILKLGPRVGMGGGVDFWDHRDASDIGIFDQSDQVFLGVIGGIRSGEVFN